MIVQRRGVDERRRRRAASTTGMLAFGVPRRRLGFLLFMLVPELDMSVARLFYSNGHFAGIVRWNSSASRGRPSTSCSLLTCIVAAAGVIVTVRTAHDWLGLGASKWLFLAVCLIAGPLVVANIVLQGPLGPGSPTRCHRVRWRQSLYASVSTGEPMPVQLLVCFWRGIVDLYRFLCRRFPIQIARAKSRFARRYRG